MDDIIDTALFLDNMLKAQPDPNKWEIVLLQGTCKRFVVHRGVIVALHTALWYQKYGQVEMFFTDTNPTYLLTIDWLIPCDIDSTDAEITIIKNKYPNIPDKAWALYHKSHKPEASKSTHKQDWCRQTHETTVVKDHSIIKKDKSYNWRNNKS